MENTKDKKVLFSTLWIFVTVNYIFCDVVTLMNPSDLRQILSGSAGSIQMNEDFLLVASIILEIPFIMILLSRLLVFKINRLANLVASGIMTLVQISSLFAGTPPTKHYIFFSIIEISCTLYIFFLAFKWKQIEK